MENGFTRWIRGPLAQTAYLPVSFFVLSQLLQYYGHCLSDDSARERKGISEEQPGVHQYECSSSSRSVPSRDSPHFIS